MPVAFGACSGEQTRWVWGPHTSPAERDALEPMPVPEGGAFASLTGTGDVSSGFDDTNIYGGLLGNEAGSASGGTGSGGIGWGTIGTGRYGTLGHGAGTIAAPSVVVGQPSSQGELDKAIIRRFVKRHIQSIQYCYEKQLLVKPDIKGTIHTQFYIDPSGNVTKSSGSGFDPDVAQCVARVLQSIEFPKPKGGGGVQVYYPFTFRPGGARPVPHSATGDLDKAIIRRTIKRNIQKITYCYEKQLLVTPHLEGTIHAHFFIAPSGDVASATASGFDPTVATCVAGVIQGIQFPKPKGGGGVQVNYPFVFRAADDTPAKPAAPAKPAVPPKPPVDHDAPLNTTNPLQAELLPLAECFRHDPVPYGAIVVELHYGAAGTVSSANVYGLDDPAARACVTAAAKHVARPANAPGTQRCSLAFGKLPPGALPAIGIADGAITYGAQSLAVPPPDSTATTIDALVSALAPDRTAVSVRGPVVIRPADGTPMKVVYAVLDSVLAADADFILAARHEATWRLLSDLEPPVAPAPLPAPGAPPVDPDDERVNLSVFLSPGHVWVGLSRVNEFQEIAAGPDLAAALAKALQAEKASAFFADRTDLEIGADDDVGYADVVTAIDAATRAGFIHWRLVRPQRLSARPTF